MKALCTAAACALWWTAAAAPPEFMTCERALEFAGETTGSGSVSVHIVPAPDGADGEHTMQLRFRLSTHTERDWIDASWNPAPPLDLSGDSAVRLWLRAEQPTPYVTLKLVDPDNPGVNRSLFESPLSYQGGPLPAGQWVPVDISLPAEPVRRDDLRFVGFYIAAANRSVPLNRNLVLSVGRFQYAIPERPAWPPLARATADNSAPAPLRLDQGGPWVLVRGKDNQTDHTAEFRDGGVVFIADAPGWNEYLWSDAEALPIEPLSTYRLQFDYQVLDAPSGGEGATFYALVRARGTISEDVGWQRWQGAPGTAGRRIVTFTTHDAPGYFLNFGIRHHGGIRLSGIRLWKAGE